MNIWFIAPLELSILLPRNLIRRVAFRHRLRRHHRLRALWRAGCGALEVVVYIKVVVLVRVSTFPAILLRELVLLAFEPLCAHLGNLLLVVELGVVILVLATEALPPGQVLPVDGNTVVVVLFARANVCPATLLLLEIQTGRVWKEE